MNYGQIKSYVRGHIHRTDIPDSSFDYWQSQINDILNQSLYSNELITREDFTSPADSVFFVASNIQRMIEIFTTRNGTRYDIRATSRDQARTYDQTGVTQPLFYIAEGRRIEIVPASEGTDYTVVYRQQVTPMAIDTDTNAVSENHLEIYTYGFLREAYMYDRDFEGAQAAEARFNSAITSVNTEAARIEALQNTQGNGASSWV